MRPLPASPVFAFILILCGTMLSIAGTDLVLPAVPSLPGLLGGTPAGAQLVLAAYVTGIAVGLIGFGELAARLAPRRLLIASLGAYGVSSLLCAAASGLDSLILLRLVQGTVGAAPAVFAVGFVRALFPGDRSVRAIGLFGSMESLMPALSPLAGAWLLVHFGWQGSFVLTGTLSVALSLMLMSMAHRLPDVSLHSAASSYGVLLTNPVFLRYTLSHALSLGGLLVFIFAAPAVITGPMGGHLSDFVFMQVSGIAMFILASNLTGRLVGRWGEERLIVFGTALSAFGLLLLLVYALAGGRQPHMLIGPALVLNFGFGLRGPPGFLRAILAAKGDDARGAALVIVTLLATTAAGTAVVAPFVDSGLAGPAALAFAISASASLCLLVLPRMRGDAVHRPG